jgi:hypothetical protein
MQERVDFAEEGLTWTPDRLFHQIFLMKYGRWEGHTHSHM